MSSKMEPGSSRPRAPRNCRPTVRVIRLPPSSPERNPVERLWDVVKDRICNQVWADLDALMAAINGVRAEYWTPPAKVRALIGNGWLLDPANPSYPSVLAA